MPNDPYYNTEAHREWRRRVLRRAKYLCQGCARYGIREDATTAHHIMPREQYPELARRVSNGAALCESCHAKQHPDKIGGVRG